MTDACAELDAWATQLDERIVPHRWEGRLRRALEAEAVAASTRMEGVAVTVADTLKILADDPPEAVSREDRALVVGYRDATRFVQRRADDGNLAWNRELVVGVQDRVLAGERGAGAGVLRSRAVWVSRADGEVVFETPDHEEVPTLVDDACAQIDGSDWHPAIAAAWLHVAIAAIHPFRDGNGRTARVLASLAMYRGGFRHPAFTSLEEWWGRHPAGYYASFACLGPTFDRTADVTPFVTSHVRAQVAQVRELAVRQQRDGLLWVALENLLDELTLPPRLANALYDSVFGRDVTTGYYRDLADTSPATARNDLAAARAAGLLASEGRTRGRRYLPGPRLLPLLAKAIGAPEATELAIAATLGRRAADAATPPPRAAQV
ncbi:Fic family protein [Conexibacter stalactiti]|uniref:Fic family protein n=1 Tax=Conexibacter stalactiti TaxID=1940611 RepID=A0ABU4HMT3_9ACTN|nr:Fic family protein [Conexibacter stalactiti]MDW5594617.1 Fic family protein [Conexibacter stalactiti]MEC5035259.1 Fic family protein [Conexibacter stalactiti]